MPELAGTPSNSDADVPHLLKDIVVLVPQGKLAAWQSEAGLGTNTNAFRCAAFAADTPDLVDSSASSRMLEVFDTVYEKTHNIKRVEC